MKKKKKKDSMLKSDNVLLCLDRHRFKLDEVLTT